MVNLFFMGCMNTAKDGSLPKQSDLALEIAETLLQNHAGKFIVITRAKHTEQQSCFLVSIRDKQGDNRR